MKPRPKETYRERLQREYDVDPETVEKMAALDNSTHVLDMDADEAVQRLNEELLESKTWIDSVNKANAVLDKRRREENLAKPMYNEEEVADRKLHPYRRKYRKTPDPLYWRVAKRRAKAEYRAAGTYDSVFEADMNKATGWHPGRPRVGMVKTDWGSLEFTPFTPGAWTKKELRNRIRWLRAEVTRIMTGKKYDTSWGTRDEALAERRKQITRYLKVMDRREEEFKIVKQQRRNARKRRARAELKKARVKEVWEKIKAEWRPSKVGRKK